MANNNQLPYILLTDYSNLYKEKYGKVPRINKFREKWAMQDVIDSVGYDRAKEVLAYYFKTSKQGHPLNFFYNNFDRMDAFMENAERDKEHRRKLRQDTQKLVEGEE